MPDPKPDDRSPHKLPRRPRLRCRRLLVAGVLLGLPLLYLMEERLRGEWLLAACRKELAARGVKLTIAGLTPALPNGTNVRVLTLGQAMTRVAVGRVPLYGFPMALESAPPGTAALLWQGNRFKAADDTIHTWEEYLAVSANNRARLPGLRFWLTNEPIHVQLDYADVGRWGFASRTASLALHQATLQALHAGDLREALENLHADARLDDLLAGFRTWSDQLIRVTDFLVAEGTVWQVLQAGEWTDQQLALLQHDWEGREFTPAMIAALRMDRAVNLTLFPGGARFDPRLLNSNLGTDRPNPLKGLKSIPWLNGAVDQIPSALDFAAILQWALVWSPEDHRRYVLGVQEVLDLVGEAWEHKALAPVCDFSLNRTNLAGNPLILTSIVRSRRIRIRRFGSDFFLGGLETLFLSPARADNSIRMMTTAIALKRYEIRHGGLPESLTALVPGFLPAVPIDVMDGQPLRYRQRDGGGFLLYSVGSDGVDQGGDPTWVERGNRGGREPRDLVWPMPAPLEAPSPGTD